MKSMDAISHAQQSLRLSAIPLVEDASCKGESSLRAALKNDAAIRYAAGERPEFAREIAINVVV